MQDLLVGFIAPRRPAGWAGALDFGSLRELPTENITDELRRRLGDVVWSIDRRAGDGGVQTLHVVIEHQSDVDYSMPLRFLNYTSLLYQRLYRDRTRWSKRDTADPVLQVVVYNGDRRWDAPVTLAGLVAGLEQDGPAQLALSYEVVDLVALKRDDLPRPNLLTWVAEVEQSVHAGALPERVRELGEWLAAQREPGLTTTFDLWLGAMGRKWGVELPSIREYEEASAVLAEKIDRWGAESWSKASSRASSKAPSRASSRASSKAPSRASSKASSRASSRGSWRVSGKCWSCGLAPARRSRQPPTWRPSAATCSASSSCIGRRYRHLILTHFGGCWGLRTEAIVRRACHRRRLHNSTGACSRSRFVSSANRRRFCCDHVLDYGVRASGSTCHCRTCGSLVNYTYGCI